ncbi:MAG: hypothetical protein D6812_04555 [Deltaproteobacteria bacterium]|nr:MAG: hypothetical protein D6812_04555 [Deltaproteobacteria bacterium]
MKFFSFERRWLLEIFEAILPGETNDRLELGARDLPMVAFLEDFLEHAPWRMRAGLRGALWVVQFSPLFLLGRPTLFTRLSNDEGARCLTRLGEHRAYLLRELPVLLKMVACMGFCAHPEVQRRIGIPRSEGEETPPWVERGTRNG